ncbi:MAG TPA: hypothetical protein VIJ35_10485 [Bradyrhizobium sp.]
MAMTRQDDFVSGLSEPHQFGQLPFGVSHGYAHATSSGSFDKKIDHLMVYFKILGQTQLARSVPRRDGGNFPIQFLDSARLWVRVLAA